jgi:uncharacterized protein YneF (UPF0154 family)
MSTFIALMIVVAFLVMVLLLALFVTYISRRTLKEIDDDDWKTGI